MKPEVRCISCVPHFLRSDGMEFRKGDWIEIPDRGIGRFMGVWDNPKLGLMSGLSYWRSFANPTNHDTLWISLGRVNEEAKATLLDTALKVAGPLSSKGKRPDRLNAAS